MDTSKMNPKMGTPNRNNEFETNKAHVSEAANELVNEGKKLANELYEEGLNKVSGVQRSVKEQSDVMIEKVRANPMAAILIAAGVGFLLNSLLRK